MLLGSYSKNDNRHGILSVPEKWLEEAGPKLYCMTCWDESLECFYLRFFSDKEETRKKLEEEKDSGQEEIMVVKHSTHRLIPNTKCIVLPKTFVEQRKKKAKKTWLCVGVIDFFEVWYEEDFEKFSDGMDQLLDTIEF